MICHEPFMKIGHRIDGLLDLRFTTSLSVLMSFCGFLLWAFQWRQMPKENLHQTLWNVKSPAEDNLWLPSILSYAGVSGGFLRRPPSAGGGAWRSATRAPQQEAQHPPCAHRWAAPPPLHQVHQSSGTQEQGQKCCTSSRVSSIFWNHMVTN